MKIKNNKKYLGFSLIEVIIAVNLLALIISILGLSMLGVERLALNAQIKSNISKIGEAVLDYIASLPVNDMQVNPTLPANNPNNTIISLMDFLPNNTNDISENIINNATIFTNVNSILENSVRSLRLGIVNSTNDNGGYTQKGRIVRFGNNQNNNSVVFVRRVSPRNNIIRIRVIIKYQTSLRNPNPRDIEVSRIVSF